MKCFVTGGSGFVGSNLISMLIKEKAEVLAMARSEESAQIIRELGATPVSVDMTDTERLAKDLQGCSVIFHLASATDFHKGYDYTYQINVKGTEDLIDAAKKAKVPKFIFVSTAAILLRGKPVYDADESLTFSSLPKGTYCKTKVLAEEVVLKNNSSEFETIIIRPPLVWGNGSAVKFMIEACKEKKMAWFNHGQYKIPVSHVKNLCHGIILASQKGKAGEMYYIIDKEHVVFRKFLIDILATQGIEPPKKNMSKGMAIALAKTMAMFWKILRKKGTPPLSVELVHMQGTEYTIVDKKARRELGYEDIVSYTEGLEELKAAL